MLSRKRRTLSVNSASSREVISHRLSKNSGSISRSEGGTDSNHFTSSKTELRIAKLDSKEMAVAPSYSHYLRAPPIA